ncbi:MAG: tRNA uridine-5-carboxymethylaminomethyl(34) synthesis GTPase MnmE [Gammaproteobacteria bacterium]
MNTDTIVAVATPSGRGAIGIVRLSGSNTAHIVQRMTGTLPPPRHARFTPFLDLAGDVLDDGILIYCPGPYSYTGEDVAEFQAHGNPVILGQLVQAACACGARPARPGEFTERAFLNGRLDLAQAEAVADLIASQSARAARSALRSLHGEFGAAVTALIARVQQTRAALEASIDFADELHAADLLAEQRRECFALRHDLGVLLGRATQGQRLSGGANVAIIGEPNVGKSSLLNRLAGSDRAIVSEFPGTTRDLVDADVLVGDIPLRLIDTAGLRQTEDPIEREGIRRTHAARTKADLVITIVDTDSASRGTHDALLAEFASAGQTAIVVHNKIDLRQAGPKCEAVAGIDHVHLSALTGAGIDLLIAAVQRALGVDAEDESEFSARSRHLEALQGALTAIEAITVDDLEQAPELVAEHYRTATQALEAIAGRYSNEDLLGDIFARFCIGK